MTGGVQKIDRPRPWRARYTGPDGRERSKTFARKTDAERWLRFHLGAVDRGEYIDPKAGDVTLEVWAAEWFAGLAPDLRPKTRAGYEMLWRVQVAPRFGHHKLKAVTAAAVREWQTELQRSGLSAARTRQARQLLGAMLKTAVDDGLLARNPVERVAAPKVTARRQRFLTAPEVEALARAAADRQPGAGDLVRFLAWSGLRWSEAVGLRAGSVDPARRRVKVVETLTEVAGRLYEGPPKTEAGNRTVILPGFIAEMLARRSAGLAPDALVFTAPKGGPVRQSAFRRNVWLPAVAAAEMPADLMPHDLRDTAASLMISAGANIKAVQRALGHSSAAMTLDVYGGLFEADLENLADSLEALHAATADKLVALRPH
jgi:integrase